jgi:cell division topological specificity factor
MNLFRLFSRPPSSAPAARERLQVLLAHERASVGGDSDLVAKLRDEILAVIAKHMKIDRDKVNVTMDRGDQMSTLAVDIEIPLRKGKRAA